MITIDHEVNANRLVVSDVSGLDYQCRLCERKAARRIRIRTVNKSGNQILDVELEVCQVCANIVREGLRK